MDWPGHQTAALDAAPLSQQPQRHVHRRHARAPASTSSSTAWAWPSATSTTTAFPTSSSPCVGQNRLFRNTGKGTFVDVTRASGLGGRQAFSTSALWVDFDRDGLLDLFVCNYVKWSAEHDVFCSLDGKQKSYCTPEAYRGETCWLFRNRGNGTFEDVTATSGIFDSQLEVARRGAARLRPGRLARPVRRQRHAAEQALSQPAQRHASRRRRCRPVWRSATTARRAPGWASTPRDFDNSGTTGHGRHQLRQRDDRALPRAQSPGLYQDVAMRAGVGAPSRNRLGLRLRLRRHRSRRRARSRRRQRPHRRDRPQHPRPTSATRSRRCSSSIRATGRSATSPRRRRRVRAGAGRPRSRRTATSIATATSIC